MWFIKIEARLQLEELTKLGITLFASIGEGASGLQEKAIELYDNLIKSYDPSAAKDSSGKSLGKEEKMVQMLKSLEEQFEEPIKIFVDKNERTPDMVKNRMFSQKRTPQRPTED